MSFIVDGPDKPPFMVVWPAWRDAYLSDHSSRAGCTVVAGCGPGGCRKGLAIDVDVNEPPSEGNVPLTVPYQGLFLLRQGELAPGTHSVRLMETKSAKDHRAIASTQVDCTAGEVIYLALPESGATEEGSGSCRRSRGGEVVHLGNERWGAGYLTDVSARSRAWRMKRW